MSGFRVPACANCGHAVWPPRLACPVCGAAEWTEVDASTGTLLDVTEAPGYDGTPTRLGTVRLAVPYSRHTGIRNSQRDAAPPEGEGPPVIAGVEGDVAVGDDVELRLADGALRARRGKSQK
jgi:predicted transcriptional regulator